MNSHWQTAMELEVAQTAFVVATLVAVRGGAPQDPGAKCIVVQEGLHHGTVGGGKIEARVIREAQAMLEAAAEKPQLFTWNLQKDIGMSCGGEVTFLLEPFSTKPWRIALFGAGHVAQALTQILITLKCRVDCYDPRAEWLAKLPEHPHLHKHCVVNPSDVISDVVAALSTDTFFAVMTQGHATDLPILEALSRHHPEPRYVGAIGSAVKAIKLRADLKAAGISPEWIARLKCPIGLEIGSNAPAEIAISIAAELLQARDRVRAPS